MTMNLIVSLYASSIIIIHWFNFPKRILSSLNNSSFQIKKKKSFVHILVCLRSLFRSVPEEFRVSGTSTQLQIRKTYQTFIIKMCVFSGSTPRREFAPTSAAKATPKPPTDKKSSPPRTTDSSFTVISLGSTLPISSGDHRSRPNLRYLTIWLIRFINFD